MARVFVKKAVGKKRQTQLEMADKTMTYRRKTLHTGQLKKNISS